MPRFNNNHRSFIPRLSVNILATAVGLIVVILLYSSNGYRSQERAAGGDDDGGIPTLFYSSPSPTQKSTNIQDQQLINKKLDNGSTNRSATFLSAVTETKHTTQSLVMCVEYSGQQGSGALCLSTLQCFLSSIYHDFKIVEPYFHSSHFSYHQSSLKFSSVFNFKVFNSESKKAHYTEMVPVEDFERQESVNTSVPHHKYIIFIHIEKYHKSSKQKLAWSTPYSTDHDNVHCLSTKHANYSQIEKRYRSRTSLTAATKMLGTIWSRRCVVRVLELEITRGAEFIMPPKPTSTVFNFIFDKWSPGDVLLIFSKWPKTFLPVQNPLSGVNCLQEYLKTETISRHQFEPSQSLLEAAKKYERQFLNNRNQLAIMFRVERAVDGYLKEEANKGKTIEDCFAKVLSLKSTIDGNFTEVSTPLVTLDIGGKYGTDSFHSKRIVELTKQVVEDLYHNKTWSIGEWESSFTNVTEGIGDGGYIAALQRLLASRADCLILLGGGDFQAFAVTDYLEFHKSAEKCIHVVCSISEENNEVHNTLVVS